MANYTFHKFRAHPEQTSGYCAAIGFFDGVHRGHQYLIDQIKAEAARRGLTPIVVTFEEHPRLTLRRTYYWPELLTTNAEKMALLEQYGLGGCAMLHFDQAMSMLTSREFMEQILRDEMGVKCLITGYDHHFGSDLSAGFKDYVKAGRELGMDVLRERPFETDELRISSSATRRFLTGGNVEMARVCLGRPYKMEGIVVRGRQKGTSIGFPTANLHPDCEEQLVPGRGVYAVRAHIGGFSYMGMLNIGWRPTFDNGDDQSIEVHLLDYDGGNLYGERLTLQFYRRVRDEQRFYSIETLQAQLAADAAEVRQLLIGTL